jgi:hypothetical protein
MEAGFEAAKSSLSRATWLCHPDPSAILALHVDSLASQVGAALHQHARGCSVWQPPGFYSRKLDSTQMKWSTFDRELFA